MFFTLVSVILFINISHYAVECGVLNDDKFRLDIIHYNDFHDRFEETTVDFPICKNQTQCLGGFARLFNGITQLLKEKPEALVLNAGDMYQGTYWYTLRKWTLAQIFVNMLPNDAHTLGNHEFDDGIDGLAPYLAGLRAPVVAANLDSTLEPKLQGLYQPHVVIERKGRQIGIIGLITPETLSGSLVKFLDPFEIARKEAQFLTGMGVNIIILLSHCGLTMDLELAKSVGQEIDIIVGGHSHDLLWNGESPTNEIISGPYPIIVQSDAKPGHKVVVVTASAFTKYLGNVTVYFDKNGDLTSFDGEPVFLNGSIKEDLEIKSLLQPYVDELHKIVDVTVGSVTAEMIHRNCFFMECTIGNLVADAFWYATKQLNHTDLPLAVILLSNNLRGSIGKGEIKRGDVISTLPFKYKVMTFIIKGRYLVEALEYCLTKYWQKKKFHGVWVPQVAGMKVTLNATSDKADSVLIKDGSLYHPVDLDKDYQITTLEPVADGRNRFKMISENLRDLKSVGYDYEIFENYLRTHSPITPYLDNRLTLLE